MGRPGARRAALRVLAWLLAAGLAAPPGGADLVITAQGGVLNADAYWVEGEWLHLQLAGQGTLLMPLADVERIVDETPAGAGDEEARAGAKIELDYRPGDPVPDGSFGELIFAVARRHRVSPELVAAVVRAESAFDPRAVSAKGARGLMQLMPATAARFGVAAERLFEPEHNLEAGVRYLSWLKQRFPGDPQRILAAYNAGEETVDRYGGVPPFRETRDYIRRVRRFLAERR